MPSGVQPGDLLLASLSIRGSATITPPVGWTLVRSDVSGSTIRLATYRRFASAGGPGTTTFTFSKTTTAAVASITAYGGVDPTTPIDAQAGQINTRNSTQAVAPSITTSRSGEVLVAVFGAASQVTTTPPTGMAERVDLSVSGSSKVALEAADQVFAGSGATGPRTATVSKSTMSIGQAIALRPAP